MFLYTNIVGDLTPKLPITSYLLCKCLLLPLYSQFFLLNLSQLVLNELLVGHNSAICQLRSHLLLLLLLLMNMQMSLLMRHVTHFH